MGEGVIGGAGTAEGGVDLHADGRARTNVRKRAGAAEGHHVRGDDAIEGARDRGDVSAVEGARGHHGVQQGQFFGGDVRAQQRLGEAVVAGLGAADRKAVGVEGDAVANGHLAEEGNRIARVQQHLPDIARQDACERRRAGEGSFRDAIVFLVAAGEAGDGQFLGGDVAGWDGEALLDGTRAVGGEIGGGHGACGLTGGETHEQRGGADGA